MSAVRAVLRCSALVVVLTLAACGGGEGSRYADEVGAVRDAVEAGDRDSAIEALQALQIDVTQAQQDGELEQDRFDELQSLIYESRLLIDSLLPPPSTAPPSTAPPNTQAPPPVEEPEDRDDEDERDDDDKDEDDGPPGNGRGRDKDKD